MNKKCTLWLVRVWGDFPVRHKSPLFSRSCLSTSNTQLHSNWSPKLCTLAVCLHFSLFLQEQADDYEKFPWPMAQFSMTFIVNCIVRYEVTILLSLNPIFHIPYTKLRAAGGLDRGASCTFGKGFLYFSTNTHCTEPSQIHLIYLLCTCFRCHVKRSARQNTK